MDIPAPYALLITPEELLASYARGERTFHWADLVRANLTRANLAEVDLTDARLVEVDLSRANLSDAKLQGANLARANLSFADLTRANLRGADLSQANLCGARLTEAILDFAAFDGADLSDTSLEKASVQDVSFERVKASGARLGSTRFINTRLGRLCDSACLQTAPSFIDLQTLIRSRHDVGLDAFIRRAGIAPVAAAHLALIARNISDADVIQSSRHVLLVSHPSDESSAAKLRDALDQRRITSYVKPWGPGALGFCYSCRVVLICSEPALRARTPLRGLPLARAPGELPPFLVVTLDDHVRRAVGRLTVAGRAPDEQIGWAALRSRVVADLSMDASSEGFGREVDKLVSALSGPT